MNKKKWQALKEALNYYEFFKNEFTGDFYFRKNDGNGQLERFNENSFMLELWEHQIYIAQSEMLIYLKSNDVKTFNPVKEYLDKLIPRYDATKEEDYIKKIAYKVKTDDPDFFHYCLVCWMVRAIKCALISGFVGKQCLILVGNTQNLGKSTYIRYLVPEALKEYYTENPSFDKDGLIFLTSSFIINFDEIRQFTKYELSIAKSYISKDKVRVRPPYESKPILLERKCSFLGSTDQPNFISDSQNVRWFLFEVSYIDWSYREISIDDCWRQAYTLYLEGLDASMSVEDFQKNEERCRKFRQLSTESELILELFRPANKEESLAIFMTATQIARELKTSCLLNINANQIGGNLLQLGFAQSSRYDEQLGYSIKGYYVHCTNPNKTLTIN